MPPPSPPPVKPASNAGTFIAALLVLVCAMSFLMLVMVVNPFIIGVIVIPLVFGPLAVVQYLVWGRWLARLQAEEQDRESANNKPSTAE